MAVLQEGDGSAVKFFSGLKCEDDIVSSVYVCKCSRRGHKHGCVHVVPARVHGSGL